MKTVYSIPIPSRQECLNLMAAHGMPPNIREHSFRVMEVACFLGRALVEAGFDLHLPLIEAGALLHDLGKAPCLGTARNHAHWGAEILHGLGYPELAQVVAGHVYLAEVNGEPRPFREAEVVNYADKRVLHDRVVTLEDRFADLMARYGLTPEARSRITVLWARVQALEENLFAPLRLSPQDLLQVNGDYEFKVQGSKFKVS